MLNHRLHTPDLSFTIMNTAMHNSMTTTESQYPHLYHQAQNIESKRENADLMYNIIMNEDGKDLQDAVMHFAALLKKRKNISNRMKSMLDIVCADKNRLLKHSLIFFALSLEPWAVKYFMKDNKTPPEKISNFVSNDLKGGIDQLLKGSFTSLQAFVEDARWRYITL